MEGTKLRKCVEEVVYYSKPQIGGSKLSHKPTSGGMVLKWLLLKRGLTYGKFGKMYNGSSSQNINHLINRSRISEEEFGKMCEILKFDFSDFKEIRAGVEQVVGDKCRS